MRRNQGTSTIKVLRVGVLQDGRVVQEARLDPGEPLTIGASPRNRVRLPLAELPRRYRLIEQRGGSYLLRLTAPMAGRISQDGAVKSLEQLRSCWPRRGGAWQVPLGARDRGSIRLGRVTLLFQFVSAPPVALRELSRPSFRPRLLDEDDPVFVAFLGLATVLAGAFAGYAVSVQTPELLGRDELPEQIAYFTELVLPAPDPSDVEPDLVLTPTDDGLTTPAPLDPEPEPEPEATAQVRERTPERPLTAQEAMAAEAQRKAQLEAQVLEDSLLLKLIGSRGDSEGGWMPTSGVFDGEGIDLDLDLELDSERQVTAQLGLKGGTGLGTSRDDAEVQLGLAQGGEVGITGSGSAAPEPILRPDRIVIPEGNGGDAERVRAVVKGYFGNITACYERRLKEIPNLQGRIEVEWVVDGGEAMDIWVLNNSTRDRQLAECIADSIDTWHFPADVVGFSVVYPFVLYPG